MIKTSRWRLQRHSAVTTRAGITSRIFAILLALLISGIVIELSGLSALTLGWKVVRSTLGSSYGLQRAGVLSTPLILTGLAVALCMRMKLWNIGVEGQLYMGAWAAAAIGLHIDGPALLVIVVMFIGAFITGAMWILIPALARAYANVKEILTTLMMNFVAVLWINYFAVGPWRDADATLLNATSVIPYRLPALWGKMHIGFPIAIGIAILLSSYIRNTRWGYEVSTIGGNLRAAEFAGMPVKRHIITVMLISGAIAGVAGAIEIAGIHFRLSTAVSNQYGYLGIIVAALASGSPLVCILAGILLAILHNAGIILQTQGLSFNAVTAVIGIILLFVTISEVLARYRLVRADTETYVDMDDGDREVDTAISP